MHDEEQARFSVCAKPRRLEDGNDKPVKGDRDRLGCEGRLASRCEITGGRRLTTEKRLP